MTDVIASGVTESEKRAIAYVNSLIEEAERLSNVASHPGRTKELVEWKNNVETYIQRVYGTASPIWGRYAKLIIIPNWFDEKKHGTPQAEDNRPVAIILSEMDIDAKNRTFQLYKESLQEIAAILKSVKNDIAVIGLPTKSNSSTSTPTNSFNTTIAPNFNQSQNQSQNQNANIKNSIQELLSMVEEKYGEEKTKEAKELLTELENDHGKWATVEKVSKFFLQIGRDAFISLLPILVKILLPSS